MTYVMAKSVHTHLPGPGGGLLNGVRLDAWQWIALALLLWIGALPFTLLGLGNGYRLTPQGTGVVNVACLMGFAIVGGPSPLTARERDAPNASVDGATVADIAAKLHLSESTVRDYLSSAIGKTGTRNRMEAVRAARQQGWL